MSAGGIVAIILGLVLVAAVVVVGVGAFALTSGSEVTSSPVVNVPSPPLDGSAAVVFDRRQSEGTNFLGIQFRSPNYSIDVQLVVPDECLQRDGSGNEVLVEDGECADIPASGELVGSGITESRQRIVFLRMDVSEQCFESLSVGDRWPSSVAECASEASG